ncbi:DNA-3-methyladenine glycosylase [Friedmanniella luteola]|uniref:Putative 3-methyladenine DNA glycosylase n=1 Tax=Friedmanniella luteola TaxID=546871 RepID=A0A1H1ZXV0_9ACTN|nr:DNA-3-methyladenine glycosylase [Friedmanniella luteola]SDT38429.1 DNA-3-methyladenine glycosylase [Friedmanniella luteola]
MDLLDGPVDRVAPTLLGGLLRHGEVVVRLTEVEAYGGASDPASHAFRGRTARTAVMFGPPGRLYVYFSYGMHWAVNIVCGPDGAASGLLLRAGEVVEGLDVARSRRGRASDRDLARGPGRLTQALGITADHQGTSVLGDGPVTLTPDPQPAARVSRGPRVGVSAEADRPWRFWLTDDRYVSAYKRSPRAPAAPT